MRITTIHNTTKQIKQFIRQPHVFPGGYPQFLVMQDDACLCHTCVKSNAKLIIKQTRRPESNTGWCAERVDVNWEDIMLTCDECGADIEPAYGEA